MKLGETVKRKGYVTRFNLVRNKTGPQLETILGFRASRFGVGWALLLLMEMPKPKQFEVQDTSRMEEVLAEDEKARKNPKGGAPKPKDPEADMRRFKEWVIETEFATRGLSRLVKVVPDSRLFAKKDYTPGTALENWKLVKRLRFRVGALIPPGGRQWVGEDLEEESAAGAP